MKQPFILAAQSSIAHELLAELRSTERQKDRRHFWHGLQRLGFLLAYECSKALSYLPTQVKTPLGSKKIQQLADELVLGVVLRAGIPMYEGVRQLFPNADTALLGIYRRESTTAKVVEEVEVEWNYVATPSLQGKVLLLIDPMLATGKSLCKAYEVLCARAGKPKALHVLTAIAAKPGLAHLQAYVPEAYCWVGDLDEELNAQAYIVPGLGDAGDLSFGQKLP